MVSIFAPPRLPRRLFAQCGIQLVDNAGHLPRTVAQGGYSIAGCMGIADTGATSATPDPRHAPRHGGLLDGIHHHDDFIAGLGGALGQLAHFIGHHGKAAPLLAGTCGLDGGIERQQIGLVGNVLDDSHNG
jgi:hypothetical protein